MRVLCKSRSETPQRWIEQGLNQIGNERSSMMCQGLTLHLLRLVSSPYQTHILFQPDVERVSYIKSFWLTSGIHRATKESWNQDVGSQDDAGSPARAGPSIDPTPANCRSKPETLHPAMLVPQIFGLRDAWHLSWLPLIASNTVFSVGAYFLGTTCIAFGFHGIVGERFRIPGIEMKRKSMLRKGLRRACTHTQCPTEQISTGA